MFCTLFFCLNRISLYTFTGIWSMFIKFRAYLPGTEDTVIRKAVPPGWGLSIALRLGWLLRSSQMWMTRVRNLLVWGSAFALTPENSNISKKKESSRGGWLVVQATFCHCLVEIYVSCSKSLNYQHVLFVGKMPIKCLQYRLQFCFYYKNCNFGVLFTYILTLCSEIREML